MKILKENSLILPFIKMGTAFWNKYDKKRRGCKEWLLQKSKVLRQKWSFSGVATFF